MLGKTVGECKATMSYRERNQWLAFAEMQKNQHEKQDWYLAQIAYELYLVKFMLGGKPKHKLNDFLLKFQVKQDKDPSLMTPAEKREYVNEKAAVSKAFWEAIVGKKARVTKPDKKKVLNQNKAEKNGNRRKHGRRPRQS